MAEAREHCVWVVALAVEQSVDAALETVAQRREQDGDEAGGGQRDEQVLLHAEQRAEVADGEDVEAGDARRQGAVDQHAVDDGVYVPEAAAQNGDADGHRYDHKREAVGYGGKEPEECGGDAGTVEDR